MRGPGLLLVALHAAACVGAPGTEPPPRPAEAPTAPDATERASTGATTSTSTNTPEPEPPFVPPPREQWPAQYLGFDGACEPGETITIAAVGDLLLHHELQIQAFAAPDRYRDLWKGVEDLFGKADLAYANLEGPTAKGVTRKQQLVDDPGLRFDNKVYTGYARFNYNPALLEDLVKAGIDVVSTANNHSLDRGAIGVDRTIEGLRAAGLPYTGTKRTDEPKAAWHVVTETKGIRIAWIACTLHTNFEKDEQGQVLDCYEDPKKVPKLVAALAKDAAIDAVIVTPHWGEEYKHEPRKKEIEFAKRLFDAGATAIIGSHPHVLQPWERVVQPDGREGFIMYSLGNFASHQRDLGKRTSMVLYLGLKRGADGKVRVAGARYVPIHVRMEGDKEKFFVEAIDRVGGPADARDLAVGMFGTPNLMAPDDPLVIAPHCERGWP